MKGPAPIWRREDLATWLMAGVSVALAALVWFSYGAARNMERTHALLAERRARETVDLLATALGRDMRGAQEFVLTADWEPSSIEPPFEARNAVASAFARYPYPESFFAWRSGWSDAAAVFFNRSDRRPGWALADDGHDQFPVTVGRYPAVSRALLAGIRADAARARSFSTFETVLDGTRYQVVVRLFYRDPFREQVDRVVGFTVSLPWARQHYFPEMTREVARIGAGAALAIVDDRGRPVAGSVRAAAVGPIVRRPLPVVFFDPLLVGVASPGERSTPVWAVQVDAGRDTQLAAALGESRRTLLVTAVAVAALALGLVLTAGAARANARLTGLRSEFVATVTHELKTPIATIRAAGDTLARGRVREPEAMRDYAGLVVQEAKRLTRLVDNLLAYSRVTDVTEVYAFEPLSLRDLVDQVLRTYARPLAEGAYAVEVDVSGDLPRVRGDRTALHLAIDNVVDNAIRYSGRGRWLRLRGQALDHRQVELEVADRGVGIAEDEVRHVTRRFFRGRRGEGTGSGLGLAIVSRIVTDHGGTLTIASTAGQGTAVRIALPAMEGDGDEADSRCRG